MSRLKVLLALLVGLSLSAFAVSLTSAQYPPLGGSVSLTTTNGNPPAGSNTPLFCKVVDTNSNPLAGVACTFTIVSEPGGPNGDAAVGSKVVVKITDSQGIATANLFVGSFPGLLTVRVDANGLSSQIVVNVIVPATTLIFLPIIPAPAAPALLTLLTAPTSTPTSAPQLAVVESPPPPIVAEIPGIRPPNTGDAGLLSRDETSLTLVLLLTTLLPTAVLVGLRLRRD